MMKNVRSVAIVLIAICFLCIPSGFVPQTLASVASKQSEQKEVKVWVNTRSRVYHCPGDRWYGKTKQGKYMGECEAQKAGYRPAYGRPCGSGCAAESQRPRPSQQNPAPQGATALCRDGTYSFSQHRRGTCSHHGGVSKWLNQ